MTEELATIVMYAAPVVAAMFIAFLYAKVFVFRGIYLITYFPVFNIVAGPFVFAILIYSMLGYLAVTGTLALGILTYGYWGGIKKRKAAGQGAVNAWVSMVLTGLLFIGTPVGAFFLGESVRQNMILGDKNEVDACTSDNPELIVKSMLMGKEFDDPYVQGNVDCAKNYNKAGALLEENIKAAEEKEADKGKKKNETEEWDDSDLEEVDAKVKKTN